ncbi:MAG: hypothetical protein FWD75_08865 [Propionibacteriaceae bacterium]|nr:hypothetical protein [Propionibacteriaceae bacterium]
MGVDRMALVARHNPHVAGIDPRSPLQIGNGDFAMAVDVTGLQTFPSAYPGAGGGALLTTMAGWGWHSMPYGRGFDLDDCMREYHTLHGPVSYCDLGHELWGTDTGTGTGRDTGTGDGVAEGTETEVFFRANPHRIDLGRIGLILPDGCSAADLRAVDQVLHLHRGLLESRFEIARDRYAVWTCVDMESDTVAVRVETTADRTGVRLSFPYASEHPTNAQDWTRPDRHRTVLTPLGADPSTQAGRGSDGDAGSTGSTARWRIERVLDGTSYEVGLVTDGQVRQSGVHEVEVCWSGAGAHEVVVQFLPGTGAPWATHRGGDGRASVAAIQDRARRAWAAYWDGGALDLAGSDHPAALELERRIVLSRYLVRVNSTGKLPVAETGLYANSWRGKFHLEMQWWHLAHFALWGQPDIVERVLEWYDATLDSARRIARRQGFPGARWLKSSGPDARETPSSIGSFLVWQQPHPIQVADLVRRAVPGRASVERWWPIVRATAEFMAAYPVPNGTAGPGGDHKADLVFPPPLIPAQECYARMKDRIADPTYELVAWVWGLRTAADWADAMGAAPLADDWRRVARRMKVPQARHGVYASIGIPPWTTRVDHPSVVAALGAVPDLGLIDAPLMGATLDDVLADWDWESTWGWDYPMMAMTATRLGRPDQAVGVLLSDRAKNAILPNGHAWQAPDLPAYLPANGGLLTAVALMGVGWDGGPARPGFGDGWTVRADGILPLP